MKYSNIDVVICTALSWTETCFKSETFFRCRTDITDIFKGHFVVTLSIFASHEQLQIYFRAASSQVFKVGEFIRFKTVKNHVPEVLLYCIPISTLIIVILSHSVTCIFVWECILYYHLFYVHVHVGIYCCILFNGKSLGELLLC